MKILINDELEIDVEVCSLVLDDTDSFVIETYSSERGTEYFKTTEEGIMITFFNSEEK